MPYGGNPYSGGMPACACGGCSGRWKSGGGTLNNGGGPDNTDVTGNVDDG